MAGNFTSVCDSACVRRGAVLAAVCASIEGVADEAVLDGVPSVFGWLCFERSRVVQVMWSLYCRRQHVVGGEGGEGILCLLSEVRDSY